jgi:uncharacterized protein (UPF0332 family)
MAKAPTDERILLHRAKNHAEYRSGLGDLGLSSDLAHFDQHVADVTIAWFCLGIEHLDDAQVLLKASRPRATYSRAYYAMYNSSKAVRYRVKGTVSLKGDDHQAAGDLPDDFPDVAKWTALLVEIYEHRLRADYDNWRNTTQEHTLTPAECVSHAVAFIADCRTYLLNKFGLVV